MYVYYIETISSSSLWFCYFKDRREQNSVNSYMCVFNSCYICLLFVVPLVGFEEVIHAVNENKEVQVVLVLTGISSINITVHVGTIDGSATGKHIATLRSS